jgi:hypothetical protein
MGLLRFSSADSYRDREYIGGATQSSSLLCNRLSAGLTRPDDYTSLSSFDKIKAISVRDMSEKERS